MAGMHVTQQERANAVGRVLFICRVLGPGCSAHLHAHGELGALVHVIAACAAPHAHGEHHANLDSQHACVTNRRVS